MKSKELLVERQIRLWEAQRKAQRKAPEVEPWPAITISRQYGAPGERLGRFMAERVGFTFWDKALVQAVADETGASEAMLEALEEHRRRAIEDAIRGALIGTAYMRSEYLQHMMRMIMTVAAHGSCIIVGRGAHIILDPEKTLRLRVVAPLETRVRTYIERHGGEEETVRQHVQKQTKERALFISQYFEREIDEPTDFDLVLNAATLSMQQMYEVVMFTYQARFGRRPPEVAPATS